MNYSKEILPLSESELKIKLTNFKQEHMNLRFQHKLGSINTSDIKKVKKNIARINTRLVEIKKNTK